MGFDNINPGWLVLGTIAVSLLPLWLGLMTGYVKVAVILSILKNSFGLPQLPGFIAELGLSVVITIITMYPFAAKILSDFKTVDFNQFRQLKFNEQANILLPLFKPWHEFLVRNCGDHEKQVVLKLITPGPETPDYQSHSAAIKLADFDESNILIIAPAFLLTELREGMVIGLAILIPFLIIDIAVVNILVSMGVSLISPQLLSFPLKLALFLSIDGWVLLTKGLAGSYV